MRFAQEGLLQVTKTASAKLTDELNQKNGMTYGFHHQW
jgi:hypothetical protein